MLVSFILITKAEAPETITVTYADGEETLSTQTILSGSTAVRPSDPVKDGFDFVGWYADEALETPYDFTQVLTEDTTIYAKWTESTEPEPETYTVTFDSMAVPLWRRRPWKRAARPPSPPIPPRTATPSTAGTPMRTAPRPMTSTPPSPPDITLYAGWTEVDEPEEPDEPDVDEDHDAENSSTVVTRPGETGGSSSETPETPDEPGTDIDEPETPLAPGVFTDVPAGHWASEAIAYVTGEGYFNGTSETTFGPSVPMSRAMLATVLWRMEGQPAPTGANTFTDVPAGQWYTDAVTWAAEQGIVTGTGNGLFDPNGDITREQLAVMLYRYAGGAAAAGRT